MRLNYPDQNYSLLLHLLTSGQPFNLHFGKKMRLFKSLLRAALREHSTGDDIAMNILKPGSEIGIETNPQTRQSLTQRDSALIPEEVFRRILRWEQHRAQRSPKFFLLVLMDVGRLVRIRRDGRVLGDILRAIARCMRGADIAGWYRENEVIGIILTEVQPLDRSSLQALVCAKLNVQLRAQLASDELDQIRYSVYFFPEDWDQPGSGDLVRGVQPIVRPTNSEVIAGSAKRAMDIVGSIVGLLLFSPFFIVLPIAIKLSSKGPVFFKQERVGQYGVRFRFLKFRSMKNGSDPDIHRDFVKRFIAGAVDLGLSGSNVKIIYKLQEDSRITRIGRFLRKSSLDELPQLINVLRGEMSLVGPRPPIPYEVDSYQYWHRRRLFEAKPGITGLWQVNGRSRTTFDDMVRLDLRYARTRSFWLDLLILLQTPRAVLSGAGAI